MKEKVEVFIPVKRHSTRVNNKSCKPFYQGINLLQAKLWQALDLFPPEKIVVLTDVEEHIKLSERMKVRHCFIPHLSNCEWPETMGYIGASAQSEYICIYRITTPFLGSEMLSKFLNYFFHAEGDYDSALTAIRVQERLFDSHFHPINFSVGKGHVDSQDTDPIFKEVCGISVVRRQDALDLHYHYAKKPLIFEVNPLLGTDINTPEDWEMIQTLLEIPSFRKIAIR